MTYLYINYNSRVFGLNFFSEIFLGLLIRNSVFFVAFVIKNLLKNFGSVPLQTLCLLNSTSEFLDIKGFEQLTFSVVDYFHCAQSWMPSASGFFGFIYTLSGFFLLVFLVFNFYKQFIFFYDGFFYSFSGDSNSKASTNGGSGDGDGDPESWWEKRKRFASEFCKKHPYIATGIVLGSVSLLIYYWDIPIIPPAFPRNIEPLFSNFKTDLDNISIYESINALKSELLSLHRDSFAQNSTRVSCVEYGTYIQKLGNAQNRAWESEDLVFLKTVRHTLEFCKTSYRNNHGFVRPPLLSLPLNI